MLVRPDERVPLAHLLTFLAHGERLAHDCAKAQAAIAPDPHTRRFLLAQARQEAFHAVVFRGAVAWLASCHVGACPLQPPLEHFRTLIEEAVRQRHFLETIMAEQIILEGLGEAILRRLEAGLVKRNAGFGRLQRILVHQEEAHHGFGRRVLDRAIASGKASAEDLRARAQEYFALTESMVTTLGTLFDSIHEDPTAYLADARRALPTWLLQ